MDAVPTPPEQETKVAPAGRCSRSLGEVRALARRLEEAAARKFAQGGIPDMAESKGVDGDLIRADAATGMTQTAIAVKHGLTRATVQHHLRAKRTASSAANGNGARKAPEGSELAALKALADAEWERLPLLERLRLLLSRGSA